jgi:hypothetical protein
MVLENNKPIMIHPDRFGSEGSLIADIDKGDRMIVRVPDSSQVGKYKLNEPLQVLPERAVDDRVYARVFEVKLPKVEIEKYLPPVKFRYDPKNHCAIEAIDRLNTDSSKRLDIMDINLEIPGTGWKHEVGKIGIAQVLARGHNDEGLVGVTAVDDRYVIIKSGDKSRRLLEYHPGDYVPFVTRKIYDDRGISGKISAYIIDAKEMYSRYDADFEEIPLFKNQISE